MIDALVLWSSFGVIFILAIPLPESKRMALVLVALPGPIVWLIFIVLSVERFIDYWKEDPK